MQRDEQSQRLLQEPVSNLSLPGELPGPSHPAQVSINPLNSVFLGTLSTKQMEMEMESIPGMALGSTEW